MLKLFYWIMIAVNWVLVVINVLSIVRNFRMCRLANEQADRLYAERVRLALDRLTKPEE